MPQDVQTRTYSRNDSVVFRMTKEAFGGLSNMASGFPLEINGVKVWSSEALYQACRFPHLPEVQDIIIRERSPMTAKMMSKPYRKDSRPDWETINVKVMRWCLRVKLVQNWETFGNLLLSTGDRPIVEESKRDKFWAAEPSDDETLVGRNVLGRLLMELREELRGPDKELLRRVEAPLMSNFLFLGKPIGAIDAALRVGANVSVENSTRVTDFDAPHATEKAVPLARVAFQSQQEAPAPEGAITETKNTWNGIPRECKRLAEVDFPVAEVSKQSAREKSIRHGHPSTLHLWWARRPLAACRAMVMALLLPDPCDQHCPAKFKEQARHLLLPVPMIGSTLTDNELQKALFKFIAGFSNWDNSANPTYLACARGLVKAAYGEQSPLVADSFAGGGSIPLEALRVGCDAFANDLNPVACLLDRILIQDVARYGHELVSRIKDVSAQLKEYLRKEVGPLYLTNSYAIPSTAYLWAREVRCEQPKCGAAIPLLRTLWLSRSEAQPQALRIHVKTVEGGIPEIELEIFPPAAPEAVSHGTIMGGNAVCPACSKPLRRSRIEAQLKAQRGGADSARLVAVMVSSEDGRHFRPPTREDLKANAIAREIDRDLRHQTYSDGLTVIPQEALNSVRPSPNARGLSAVTRYGMMQFADCHLARQRVTLAQITKFLRTLPRDESGIGAAVKRSLLVLLGRCVDRWSSCCRLDSTRDTVTGSFSKQALQLVWDFCEANPFSEWSGGLDNSLHWILKVLERTGASLEAGGDVHLGDARDLPLPDESAQVWFTDPPYYDSVPYADLSDFFYCWLRRAAFDDPEFRDPWDHQNSLTPKLQECVWNQAYAVDGKFKDSVFFEHCVGSAFSEGRRILQENGIGCIVFAHKTTEGWEALLRGIVGSRLVITSSWPIQTEMKSRTAARDAASLMGSIHLVCRRRSTNAPIGDWGEVLQQLPGRIGDWMEKLSSEGIRGADLVFSCIGPALELFSKFERVETAEGREVKLDEFLVKVWEVVGRSALQQILGTAEARARNGAAAALEEDARLTALFLWTLQSVLKPSGNDKENENEEADAEEGDEEDTPKPKKGYILIYDVVRRFAQPLGIHLEHWDGRIIETKKGIVRLIPVLEREEQLFGRSGTNAVARALERTDDREPQYMLFPEEPDTAGSPKRGKGSRKGRAAKREDGEAMAPRREATTLDRLHAAILLQARGEATALRALLQSEIERSPDFLRLSNALSALYPKDSEEKRLLDAMLLAVPR